MLLLYQATALVDNSSSVVAPTQSAIITSASGPTVQVVSSPVEAQVVNAQQVLIMTQLPTQGHAQPQVQVYQLNHPVPALNPNLCVTTGCSVELSDYFFKMMEKSKMAKQKMVYLLGLAVPLSLLYSAQQHWDWERG